MCFKQVDSTEGHYNILGLDSRQEFFFSCKFVHMVYFVHIL